MDTVPLDFLLTIFLRYVELIIAKPMVIPNVSTCRILKICTAVTLGRTRQRLINDVWIITDADDYAPLNKNMDQKKLSVL